MAPTRAKAVCPHREAHPVVGVLGGMGPQATVDFMQRVVGLTPAQDDADHVHMIVDSNPKVPSRIGALIDNTGPSPAPELRRMAQRLQAAGADVLAMPCNTAHHYLDQIESAVTVPMLDMVALTAGRIRALGVSRVGMLASTAVELTNLYGRALKPLGAETVFPGDEDQQRVMALIKAVKRNAVSERELRQLHRVCRRLIDQGAGLLLVSCTELSAPAARLARQFRLLDSLSVLAEAVIETVAASRGHPGPRNRRSAR